MRNSTIRQHAIQTWRVTLSRQRSRGSLLLLVVAALLFMLLMGLTYMEVAKQDRISTRNLYIKRDLDLQLREVGGVIAGKLRLDLAIDTNGTPDGNDDSFFNLDDPNGDGRENYDYPGPVDPWLAETIPTLASSTYGQITLLGDTYSPGGNTQNDVQARDVSTIGNADIISNPRADADGDQLLDAKFEDAPMPMLHGVRYYMAVRILDNSSLVNLNTAVAMNNAGDYGGVANAPRWWYPSELNAINLVNQFSTGFYGDRINEFLALQNHRTSSNARPMPWGFGLGERGDYWLNGPAVYGNTWLHTNGGRTYNVLSNSEFELAYRWGLNDHNLESELEQNMKLPANTYSRFLHSDPVPATPEVEVEIRYDDAPDVGNNNYGQYFSRNPRLYFTTLSGSAIYAPTVPGESGTVADPAWPFAVTIKRDINKIIDDEVAASGTSTPLANVIDRLFSYGIGGADPHIVPNTSSSTFTGVPQQVRAMSDMLALNIVDYRDADSRVSSAQVTTDAGAVTMYGLEALPYIAEVYAQRAYTYDGTTDNMWEADDATQVAGYAIEIRNPHRRPVDLQEITLRIGGAAGTTLYALTGSTKQFLDPDEVLLLYRNSTGGTNDTIYDGSNGATDLVTGAVTAFAINETWPDNAGHAEIEIELQVKDSSATDRTYQKVRASAMSDDAGAGDPMNPPGDGDQAYYQGAYVGNGNGVNVMTYRGSDMAVALNSPPADNSAFTYDNGSDGLGEATKGGPADKITNPTNYQIAFNDSDYIAHVGELALVTTLTWQDADGHRIADQWAAGIDFFLDFSTTTATEFVDSSYEHLAVPHAVMLIDRFTTLSPFEDNWDNDSPENGVAGAPDGDGVDLADTAGREFFVPGTLNINTMPDLAWYAIPIADDTTRDNIRDAIKAYRDDPTMRPNNHRNRGGSPQKGIAMMGELMNIFNGNNTAAVPDPFGADSTDNVLLGTTGLDFLSNPTYTTAAPLAHGTDGITDDIEEKSMLMRWLSQVCTTRSDIFTAHVLIRGYRDQPPRDAFVERRAVMIFDRSGVEDNNGRVRLVGMHVY